MGFLELGPALALPVCHTGSCSEVLEFAPDETIISCFGACVEVIGGLVERPFDFFTSLVTLSFVCTLPFLAGLLVILLSGVFLAVIGVMGVFAGGLDMVLDEVLGRFVAEELFLASSLLSSLRDFEFGFEGMYSSGLDRGGTSKDTDDTDRLNPLGVCRRALRSGASIFPEDRLLRGLDPKELC